MKLAVIAVVALFALSACTPEEIIAVESAYRASVEAEAREAARPTWSVEADCAGAHVVLTRWTGVTDVSPSTGRMFVIFGMGDTVGGIPLDEDGSVDTYVAAGGSIANTAWGWSLLINGEPGLPTVTGHANC